LLAVVAKAGDPHRASRLAAEAEASLRTLPGAGDQQDRLLTELATKIAQGGDPDRAEALARTIPGLYRHPEAVRSLVTAIAKAGDPDRAEALARTIPDPLGQAGALTGLVTAAAEAGDPDRATRLAAEAEALARLVPRSHNQIC
jgi:uridine phosphorylase